ncbi:MULTISPECIES: hydrolase [unclassified Uliginosibacterium]|uniref:hydrolase n=1 Tax=unclassified Uliginosibacterium TaxID=2621521 RepID=UPI000C7BE1AD|nr:MULTISPECIES: hydrolase [unclassified Uliginosibacterium]MDO6384778.1 hydrolase [Uliginosibacterium sp. 31-12]PLK48469.1 hydrolase [Uliginosibacterium sp. TH139]
MKYTAPVWLRGAHAQTIWPLAIKGDLPPLRRKRWKTPDEDFIDLDFLPSREGQPIVILFHGLEGSSRSHYARSLMREVHARGWNGAVVHFRGCSGEPNRLPRAYHSGDANEVDWILRRFARKYPEVPRYAAGVSLGGNALLCWLGSRREEARGLINKAASVSAPVDMLAAGYHLGQGFNKIYTRYFLSTMRPRARQKAEQFPGRFDASKAIKARNLAQFDDAFTAPLHGFKGVEDYWKRASSRPLLASIAVPTLMLHALNDPFMPIEALPSQREISPHVRLDFPPEGGHVGFVTGPFPGRLDWMPKRLLRYFEHAK